MNKNRTQQQLYIIFWIIIVILIGLIGWFTYLLIQPDDTSTPTTANTETTTNSANTNTEKKSKKKKNTNANSTTNANSNSSAADSTITNSETDDSNTTGGLVEPADSETETNDAEETVTKTDETIEADTEEGDKTVMLYFPKSASSCGEVYPVERRITESDDPYGQIILEVMDGPTEDETGYTSAVPADLYLRQVEYTADGAVITVSEAYDNLDNCAQQTVDAQLVETANAMFELPEDTTGEVVVGTVHDDTEEEGDAKDAETDTDSE